MMSVIEGLDYGMTEVEARLVLDQVPREQAAGLASTWRSITQALERMGKPPFPKPECILAAEKRAVPPVSGVPVDIRRPGDVPIPDPPPE